MKKNLLLLCTILVTLSFFNSCSDDDKNQEWENLPSGPIQSDKVSIDLNGTATSGTVTLKATSNEAAQLQFQNVIPGYSDVTVDVKMVKQPDNSFTFSGTKDIATAPTKAEATPVFLTVTVNGTIAVDGKVTVNIATSGLGTYIGTYSGTTLKLMYGDSELTGKSVVFDATQPQDASIKLTDVIPGDTVTLLTGIQLNDNGFSGSSTTTAGKVDYTGALKDKVLTLNLNVTMNDPQGWAGTYGLAEITYGTVKKWVTAGGPTAYKEVEANDVAISPFYISAKATIPSYSDFSGIPQYQQHVGKLKTTVETFPLMLRRILGAILPQVLKSINLEKDGNITAAYSSDTVTFNSNWAMSTTFNADSVKALISQKKWLQSPKNLAYWFEKDNKLYIKLNVAAIINQAIEDNGQTGVNPATLITAILNSTDGAKLKQLILSNFSDKLGEDLTNILKGIDDATFILLLDWVKNGIPLNITNQNEHTYIFLDKANLTPAITVLPALIPMLKEMNPMGMGEQLGGSLGTISYSWKIVETYNIGIDLVKQ